MRSPYPAPGPARGRPRLLLIASMMTLALIGPNMGRSALVHPLSSRPQPPTGPLALGNNMLPQPLLDHSATLVAPYPSSQMLRVVFSLYPAHPAEEQQFLRDVQTKGSPLFHHFLTADQWNARFGPSAQSEQAVLSWAQAQGLTVTHRYPNRLLVDVAAPVSTIQSAFHLSINTYKAGARTFFSNDRAPTLPAALSGIVEAVLGLNNWETAHPANSRFDTSAITNAPAYVAGPVVASGTGLHHNGNPSKMPSSLKKALRQNGISPHITGGAYDPTDVYSSQMYDYNALQALGHCCNPTNAPESLPQGSIAIATAFAYDGNDLNGWFNSYQYLAGNVQPVYIDGTPSTSGGGETTEDTNWTIATANSFGCWCTTAKVWVYEGVNANFSTFDDVYNQILTDGHARSFSTSWGCTEFTCTPDGTMNTDENIFNSMVGQGWTLSVAADDKGAFADCNGQYRVQFPASSPDVVAAGGTNLSLDSNSNYLGEQAWVGASDTGSCNSNYGGGGGGCSIKFINDAPWQNPVNFCPNSGRNVPDISLNADFGLSPQNIFLGGSLQGNGGTSMVAPELAGFFAQEDAYLLAIGNGPLGNPDVGIYNAILGNGVSAAPHNPFYDVTSGCTNGGTGNCAYGGYDPATGWGSANMLQLAWALNWQILSDSGRPQVNFSGPSTGVWYNFDQTVSWSVVDTGGGGTPSGVAGYSYAWDSDPGDPTSHSTPGCCDSFYNGPEVPNGTSGSLDLAAAGQGCHTANVQAWDNMGLQSFDQTYGSVCYDTITPNIDSVSNSPAGPTNAGSITTFATSDDPGCGGTGSCVANIYYYVNTATDGTASGSWNYLGDSAGASGNLSWSTAGLADGVHLVSADPQDYAGNFLAYAQNPNTAIPLTFDTTPPQTTASLSGAPAGGGNYYAPVQVTLTANDTLSGVASTTYQIDGGSAQTYSGPFNVNAVGSHTVTFYSTDNAGNVESTQSVSFTIVSGATATPTKTPVGPTATPTRTPVPPTKTPTKTPVPPTPTRTPVPPTPTKTPVLPTPTKTPVKATATPTRTPLPPTSTPTASASISLSRSSGRYKDPVTVTGSGFGHSETVNVYLDTTASTPLTSTSSSASGGLSAVFEAPQAISGTHTILAVGQSSGRSGSAPWLELPGAYLLHYQGNKGSTDVLKGAGFAPHETVTGYWNTTSGVPFGFTATTNSVGTFGGSSSYPGITFTVPLSPTGQYPVYAVGQSSHGVAHATFTLNPSLSVKPTSAHAGAVVTVSGTGYGANETVTIKYNCGTSGCSSTTVLGTPTTDSNGFFSTSVTLPGTTSMGVHALGGKGTTSGVFATTSITIT